MSPKYQPSDIQSDRLSSQLPPQNNASFSENVAIQIAPSGMNIHVSELKSKSWEIKPISTSTSYEPDTHTQPSATDVSNFDIDSQTSMQELIHRLNIENYHLKYELKRLRQIENHLQWGREGSQPGYQHVQPIGFVNTRLPPSNAPQISPPLYYNFQGFPLAHSGYQYPQAYQLHYHPYFGYPPPPPLPTPPSTNQTALPPVISEINLF